MDVETGALPSLFWKITYIGIKNWDRNILDGLAPPPLPPTWLNANNQYTLAFHFLTDFLHCSFLKIDYCVMYITQPSTDIGQIHTCSFVVVNILDFLLYGIITYLFL